MDEINRVLEEELRKICPFSKLTQTHYGTAVCCEKKVGHDAPKNFYFRKIEKRGVCNATDFVKIAILGYYLTADIKKMKECYNRTLDEC
jgi:hypothetical protein